MKFGIGQGVARLEDGRFLTGRAQFTDDIRAPGQLFAAFLRSPVAHGRISALDAGRARNMPGVAAVLTGDDLVADGIGGIGCHTLVPGMHKVVAAPPVSPLSTGRLGHVGAIVAVVVADHPNRAVAATEAIDWDFDELTPMLTPDAAMAEGAAAIRPDTDTNLAFTIDIGDAAATAAALAEAAHVTRLALVNNRVSANSLEMRATRALRDPRDGRLTVHTSTQAPHAVRGDIATALGLPHGDVRVIAPDVGGGFGMKGGSFPEDVLVAWAACRLSAPVCWQATRSESLVSDYHGRDQHVEAELGLDGDGRITALRVRCDYNQGAHLSTGGGVSAMFSTNLASGCYRVPVAHASARGVCTNTSPTQPYRGAGRPEASFLIERLMDKAAAELGQDRIALRRKNLIAADEMPCKTPLLYQIDGGDYAALMDRAMDRAGWDSFADRRAVAAARGRRRGIGIAMHMENSGLGNEACDIRFDPSGSVTATVGTFSHGQGHETVYAQMIAEWFSVPPGRIRIVQGDTDRVGFGRGTVASRSMINGGGALRVAADRVIEKGRAFAAHLLEAAADDIAFEDGMFAVTGTDRRMPIAKIAELSYKPIFPPELGLGLAGQGDFLLRGFTFPSGCQIAEVEVDPETGVVAVCGIVSVDDVGRVINPVLLEGQIVGGIVQGLGQALWEDFVYDDSGQPLTGSFMDYAMPRAADIPPIDFLTMSTPTASNPLGVRGAGEAGTVGATPAVISAVLDALRPLGVRDIALPATPARVWRAIRDAAV